MSFFRIQVQNYAMLLEKVILFQNIITSSESCASSISSLAVHKDFRLWITTEMDHQCNSLPGEFPDTISVDGKTRLP